MTETIDSVCKRFCPIFHMHPREQYKPCSVPDLMRNSVFEYTETMTISAKLDRNTDVLFETTQPPGIQSIIFDNATLKAADTKEKLEQLMGKYTTKENKVSRVYCFRILVDNIDNSIEVQAIFSDPFTYMKKIYFSVTYVLFFPYNGTLEPHMFDQEYATFIFTCSNYKYTNDTMEVSGVRAVRVFLSSHGKGKWYDWKDEITKTPEGRPVLYSALEGHALYTEPMVLRRFFGLGNDETSEGGEVYDPINNVIVIAHPSSILVVPYYEKNKLYYYNGLYNDQQSSLFSTDKSNFIYYDGYYKTTNTSEMWDIEPFSKFKDLFKILLLASAALVVLIVMDNNDICVLTSYLFLIIFTIIITFFFMWLYIV